MKEEYIIVSKTSIEKKIEKLKNQKKAVIEMRKQLYFLYKNTTHLYTALKSTSETYTLLFNEQKILEGILSQSTPLIPEIEKAWLDGNISSRRDFKEDYTENLNLNI